jgi:hypothetical protein
VVARVSVKSTTLHGAQMHVEEIGFANVFGGGQYVHIENAVVRGSRGNRTTVGDGHVGGDDEGRERSLRSDAVSRTADGGRCLRSPL